MKLFRAITMVLILALASSPALAFHCATLFASDSVMTALHPDIAMSGMKHCQEEGVKKDHTESDNDLKPCAMGAGCHFTQATPVSFTSKHLYLDLTKQSFPLFTPSEKSVDLSPPLKPPA